jgi:PAS domain S-box-containing protein
MNSASLSRSRPFGSTSQSRNRLVRGARFALVGCDWRFQPADEWLTSFPGSKDLVDQPLPAAWPELDDWLRTKVDPAVLQMQSPGSILGYRPESLRYSLAVSVWQPESDANWIEGVALDLTTERDRLTQLELSAALLRWRLRASHDGSPEALLRSLAPHLAPGDFAAIGVVSDRDRQGSPFVADCCVGVSPDMIAAAMSRSDGPQSVGDAVGASSSRDQTLHWMPLGGERWIVLGLKNSSERAGWMQALRELAVDLGILVQLRSDAERAALADADQIGTDLLAAEEISNDHLILLDHEMRLRHINERSRKMLRLEPESRSWRGRRAGSVFPDWLGRHWERWLREVLESRTAAEDTLVHPVDNREFVVRALPVPGGVAIRASESTETRNTRLALDRSGELRRQQFWQSPLPALMLDTDLQCRMASRRLEEVSGLRSDQLEGMGWLTMIHLQDRPRVLEALSDAMTRAVPLECDARVLGADGSPIAARHWAEPQFDARDRLRGFQVVLLDLGLVSDTARAHHKSARVNRVMPQWLQQVELQYAAIARELHDELGQSIAAAQIELRAALRSVSDEPCADRLQAADRLIAEVATRIREVSMSLRPAILDDLGLVPALRWYADCQARSAGCEVQIDLMTPMPGHADKDVELACFRIAQGAISNVARHSGARRMWVRLRLVGKWMHLVVADNGAGFAPIDCVTGARSMGIAGMHERAEMVGGHLGVRARPGVGTLVRARLPLDETRS